MIFSIEIGLITGMFIDLSIGAFLGHFKDKKAEHEGLVLSKSFFKSGLQTGSF